MLLLKMKNNEEFILKSYTASAIFVAFALVNRMIVAEFISTFNRDSFRAQVMR